MTDLIEDMKYTILTGEVFKEFFGFFKFYKLTSEDEFERQYKLQDGYNHNELTFKNDFCDNGITFHIQDNLFKQTNINVKYIRNVEILDDATVFIDSNSFRTDKMILSKRIDLSESDIWNDLEFCKQTLIYDHRYLSFIKNPPNELIEYILSKKPIAIECIENPSNELIEKVIKDAPYMIRYIKNARIDHYLYVFEKNKYTLQSLYIDPIILEELIKIKPEIKVLRENNMEHKNTSYNYGLSKGFEQYNNTKEQYNQQAYPFNNYKHKNKNPKTMEEIVEEIKKNPYYIKNVVQTQELCDLAFSLNKDSFRHIDPKFIDTKMCNEALAFNNKLLGYIPPEYISLIDESLIISALKQNGRAIDHIPNPTQDMCFAALSNCPEAIYDIKEKERSPELIEYVIKMNPKFYHLLDKIETKDEQTLKDIVKTYPTHFAKIVHKTKELSDMATFKCPEMLKYVPEEFQDEEMCLTITYFSPICLQYVINQTEQICLNAVSRNGLALKYVKNKTPEICQKALENTPYALEFIENQTEDICIYSIKKDIKTIGYILTMTERILEVALDLNPGLFRDAANMCPELLTEEIICQTMSKNGLLLKFVPDEFHIRQNFIIDTAIDNNPEAIEFVPTYKLTQYIINKALSKNGNVVRLIPERYLTEDNYVVAVNSQANSLRYISIENQTDKVCFTALKRDPLSFEYLRNKKPEYCFYAVSKNAANMSHINSKNEVLYQMCLCVNPKAVYYIKDIDIRKDGMGLINEIENLVIEST